ncbi:MAG: DUF3159 domain-containing protein [Actinomycetota bacterium]|nr:DUF3159 domain-containing protein [Actinomycetota bacterium]
MSSASPTPTPGPGDEPSIPPASVATVEAVVRAQLSKALGGRRGMIEAAVPTVIFTVLWLTTRELPLAVLVSVGAAVLLLLVRIVQRSSPQFVINALFGIGIGYLFVRIAASRGGSADEQALAYFLPGILYNSGYAVVLSLTCLIGWPLVGFMVGSVTGDATGWHADRQVVKLCSILTWLLALPCVLRVAGQAPIWLAANADAMDADAAIAILGVLKIGLGWPLQLAALAAMAWVLGRDRTPVRSA